MKGTHGAHINPSAREENEFIRLHGFDEYGKWHLGIDDEENEDTKKRLSFPTAISKMFTAARCFRQKAGRDNSNILTSNVPRPTCTG
jgi:hypothetical protein